MLFGMPLEEHWPYSDDKARFDQEPPSFCHAFAQNYQTIKYFRHDPAGSKGEEILKKVKTYLASGHPAMFGFTVYNSGSSRKSVGHFRSL